MISKKKMISTYNSKIKNMDYMIRSNRKVEQNSKIIFGHKTSCIMIFFVLYFSQSIMFRELISARYRILLIFMTWLFLAVLSQVEKKHLCIGFNHRQLIIVLILFGCINLSCAYNGLDVTFDGYTIILLFLAILLVSTIKKHEFIISYIDVMCFIGFTSTIIFISYKVMPNMFELFPDYYWHGDILIKNCYLCAIPIAIQNYRNFGIFYEPGMFSLFLIWALLFSLFHVKINVKKIIILLVALGSTLSTSGYLCGCGLIVLFVFCNKNVDKSKKNLICLVLVIVCSLVMFYLTKNLNALNFLISKFDEIKIVQTVNRNMNGSGYERWRSIVYAIECFLSNPILGVAATGWQIKFDSIIGTATPLNWFGMYGFLYGSTIIYLYCKSMTLKKRISFGDFFIVIGLSIVALMNIMSQNVTTDITVFMIILYGVNTISSKI